MVQFEIGHDAAGLAELQRRLCRLGSPPVAIERPSGLLVDSLVEAGFRVVPIHPNAVKASRPRYRSHGGKSDASDAYLLADLLRTDGHRFKALTPQGDEILALRALVRGRDDLVAARVQLANQLRSLLESFWPGAAAVFADVDSLIALAFIERYPTPGSASRLGPKRMAAFCAQHAYCGRRSAEELLARLHEAPVAVCAELEMQAKGELARCMARTLARLVEQLRLLSSRIEHHVASLDDGQIVMSFPRAGRICAAQRQRPEAAITRTPSASSPEHGCASSGAPGPIAKPTIRLNTAPLNCSSKQPGVDTGCLMTTALSYVIKFVGNMDDAVRFHSARLGLKLRFQSPEWSEFETGQTTLALHQSSAEHPAGTCQRDFRGADIDRFYSERVAEGVQAVASPYRSIRWRSVSRRRSLTIAKAPEPVNKTHDITALQEMLEPLLPGLMGVRLLDLAADRVVAEMSVRADLCTSGGILHGGAYMAFADTLGAVGTVLNLPAGKRTTTTDSSTKFMAGARVNTTITGESVALHRGRTTMVWQTSIRNADGKLCAVVTQTQLVLEAAS